MSDSDCTTKTQESSQNPIVCATCYGALKVRRERFSTYVEACEWCRERAIIEATHQGRVQGLEQCERIVEAAFGKVGAA